MSGLIDSAVAVMGSAARRTEIAAINVANISTPGFKRVMRTSIDRGVPFANTLSKVRADLRPGKMIETGRPFDLSINGEGFFQLRSGDRIFYSREGGFARAADGTMVTARGHVLQQAGGGDLTVGTDTAKILPDGTVTVDDQPTGRIAVYRTQAKDGPAPLDGALFTMTADSAEEIPPSLRPGTIEASNVSIGDEMTGTMAAMRDAETGAKLVQVYDDLMGRVIQAFGQAR